MNALSYTYNTVIIPFTVIYQGGALMGGAEQQKRSEKLRQSIIESGL